MCNLGEGIVEQVTAEVTASVTASVTESVQTDTWKRSAINIMKKFNIGIDEAIETLEIPAEKREAVKAKIEEELVPA